MKVATEYWKLLGSYDSLFFNSTRVYFAITKLFFLGSGGENLFVTEKSYGKGSWLVRDGLFIC